MAERTNGILKVDFKLNRLFKSHNGALLATKKTIAKLQLIATSYELWSSDSSNCPPTDPSISMHWKKKKIRHQVST